MCLISLVCIYYLCPRAALELKYKPSPTVLKPSRILLSEVTSLTNLNSRQIFETQDWTYVIWKLSISPIQRTNQGGLQTKIQPNYNKKQSNLKRESVTVDKCNRMPAQRINKRRTFQEKLKQTGTFFCPVKGRQSWGHLCFIGEDICKAALCHWEGLACLSATWTSNGNGTCSIAW